MGDQITGGGGGSSGDLNNPTITGTSVDFFDSLLKIEDGSDRVEFNAEVYEFKTGGLNRLYMTGKAGAYPQLTTLGADLWMEPGDEDAPQGSIGAYNASASDIGYSTLQQADLPGARPFRNLWLTDSIRFVAPGERASMLTAGTTHTKLAYTGTVADGNQLLTATNLKGLVIKSDASGTRYIESYLGYSSIFKTQQNVDMWVNDAKFVSYSSTAAKARAGTATLVGGTVTIANTTIAASDKVFVTRNTPGGTVGDLSVPDADISVGTSFKINSASGSDTSTVNWWIINKQS